MLATHDFLLHEEVVDPLNQGRGNHAQQEVEAEENGFQRPDKIAQNGHHAVGQQITQTDQHQLHGQLVDAAVHGNLIFALNLLQAEGFTMLILTAPVVLHALPAQDVQMDDTADTGAEEAQRGDGQTEASAAHKAVFLLVDVAVVQCLTGALTETEGQDHACCGEQVLDNQRGNHGNAQTQDALQQVGGHRGDAGIKDLAASMLVEFAAGGL